MPPNFEARMSIGGCHISPLPPPRDRLNVPRDMRATDQIAYLWCKFGLQPYHFGRLFQLSQRALLPEGRRQSQEWFCTKSKPSITTVQPKYSTKTNRAEIENESCFAILEAFVISIAMKIVVETVLWQSTVGRCSDVTLLFACCFLKG